MCPICMATTALIVAGSGSTCGLLTVAVKKIRDKKQKKDAAPG